MRLEEGKNLGEPDPYAESTPDLAARTESRIFWVTGRLDRSYGL
jgi:hypothetical protein